MLCCFARRLADWGRQKVDWNLLVDHGPGHGRTLKAPYLAKANREAGARAV